MALKAFICNKCSTKVSIFTFCRQVDDWDFPQPKNWVQMQYREHSKTLKTGSYWLCEECFLSFREIRVNMPPRKTFDVSVTYYVTVKADSEKEAKNIAKQNLRDSKQDYDFDTTTEEILCD